HKSLRLRRRGNADQPVIFPGQILQKIAIATVGWVASVGLFVATASGQDGILPELPQASSPVMLTAASDPTTGKSEFRYQGKNTPPVTRVQPGSVPKVEDKNQLPAQSKK